MDSAPASGIDQRRKTRVGGLPEEDGITASKKRSGSSRKREAAARKSIIRDTQALRDSLKRYADLLRADQALIRAIDQHDERQDALALAGRDGDEHAVKTLERMIAKLTHALSSLRHFDGMIEELAQMDLEPRMTAVVDIEESFKGSHVVSMIDGTEAQVLTRRLARYDIDGDDYRRLFGLPEATMLWTEKLKQARQRVMTKNRVWAVREEARRNRAAAKAPRRARGRASDDK